MMILFLLMNTAQQMSWIGTYVVSYYGRMYKNSIFDFRSNINSYVQMVEIWKEDFTEKFDYSLKL